MTPIGSPFSGALPLLVFLAKATLLLVVAFACTVPLRRATAGARHLLWLAALVGVVALPVLGRVVPLRVAVLPRSFDSASSARQAAAPSVASTPSDARVGAGLAGEAEALPTGSASRDASVAPPQLPVAPGAPASSDAFDATVSALSALQILALVWAGVALALLGWLVAGAWSVRRIASAGRELTSPDWSVPLCEVADRLDLDSAPRLVVSDVIEMAFACRALVPTIVLPAAAESWTDDRRRAVLMHELAHIKRHDLLGHALGRMACALYWFHPLVWVAAKNLRAESERACDDLVLSCGTRASEYAQHLLDMVTSVRRHGAPVMALPMARKREFEGRMLAILDPAIRRASPGRLQAAGVAATIGVLSLTIAAIAPVPQEHAVATAQQSAETTHVAAKGGAPEPIRQVTSQTTSVHMSQSMSTSTSQAISRSASRATSKDSSQNAYATGRDGSWAGATVEAAIAKPIASVVTTTVDNVFRALGGRLTGANAGTDSARVTLLVHLLATDSDASVRRTAAWALDDTHRADARDALIKALRSDASSSVRETAAWALASYSGAEVTAALEAGLRDADSQVRATSAWATGTTGAASQAGALERALTDSSAHVRQLAIWALGQLDLHTAPPKLAAALGDKSTNVREIAAWALGQIADSGTAPAIIAAFQSEQSTKVRTAELWALTSMGKASDAVLDAALKSSDPEIRRRAVSLLAGGEHEAGPWPWPWPCPRPFPD
jgi:beta-lactamase regulating signal transducer with metallopeptidase domain/HEAT repeat protein